MLERGALLVVTFFFLAPVVWLITTAYEPSVEIFSYPPTLTFVPTLENFRGALRHFDLSHLLESSVIISVGPALLSLLLGVPAAYALARAKTPHKSLEICERRL